jgi:hypothetical protein
MKLSIPQLQTLKRLTNGARSSVSFTTTETYSPGSYHCLTHLKNLEMNGFVVEIDDMWRRNQRIRLAMLMARHMKPMSKGTGKTLFIVGVL